MKAGPTPFMMNLESPLPMVLRRSAVRVRAPPSCRISSKIRGDSEPAPATSTSVSMASGESSRSISECWRAPIGSTGSMLMESIAAKGIGPKVSMIGSPSPSRTGRNISSPSPGDSPQ